MNNSSTQFDVDVGRRDVLKDAFQIEPRSFKFDPIFNHSQLTTAAPGLNFRWDGVCASPICRVSMSITSTIGTALAASGAASMNTGWPTVCSKEGWNALL